MPSTHPAHFHEYADEAEDLLEDVRPVIEGRPVLSVMFVLGELLAVTLAHNGMDRATRMAFVASIVGRAEELAGESVERLH